MEILPDRQLLNARDPVSLAWPLSSGARILIQMVRSDLTGVLSHKPAPGSSARLAWVPEDAPAIAVEG